jgi:F0F1-type ATP synthase membrane subunit b/b'
MFNEKFWLAIAFTSFVLLILKYVRPLIIKALDNKSKQIAEEILAAKEMKEKALRLLERAEKSYEDSINFSQKIIKDAEIEAQKFATESQKMIEQEISKKTAAALDRIKLEQDSAIREIKQKIISAALQIFSKNVEKETSRNQHDQLISRAIENFEKIH